MKTVLAGSALLLCGWGGLAYGSQILVNGGFETGTFSGWTIVTEAGSSPGSNFFVSSGTKTPQSNSTTAGPASGSFYAVSDGLGPEAHALIQQFTIPSVASSVVLSFSLFVNSYSPAVVNSSGLDYTTGGTPAANQHARVDILRAGASAFDTGAGVLRNFYLGADSGPNPHGYTNYSFNVTSLVGAGGAFQLRFAEVDNLNTLNLGVDNASINFTPTSPIPEPGGIAILSLGLAALAIATYKRKGLWRK